MTSKTFGFFSTISFLRFLLIALCFRRMKPHSPARCFGTWCTVLFPPHSDTDSLGGDCRGVGCEITAVLTHVSWWGLKPGLWALSQGSHLPGSVFTILFSRVFFPCCCFCILGGVSARILSTTWPDTAVHPAPSFSSPYLSPLETRFPATGFWVCFSSSVIEDFTLSDWESGTCHQPQEAAHSFPK